MTTRFDPIRQKHKSANYLRLTGASRGPSKVLHSFISSAIFLASLPVSTLAASAESSDRYSVASAAGSANSPSTANSARYAKSQTVIASEADAEGNAALAQTVETQSSKTQGSAIQVVAGTKRSSIPEAARTGKDGSIRLTGGVQTSAYPFKEDGSSETIPQGTALNLTVTANLNSELAKEGDEIRAEVSTDLKDGSKVLLPGKWQVVGKVAHVQSQKRMGRDGFIEIKFEKLVSPDGKWEVPLDATASTKESAAKTVTKQVLATSGRTAVGALGGSLLSVQLTGLPLAISTYGISVGAGAAIGGALGVASALRRKGEILCALPGDEIQIRLPSAITIPAFNQSIVPSKAPTPVLHDLNIVVKDPQFLPYPFGDKKSRLLTLKVLVENEGKKTYSFSNFAVKCSHNHEYYPYAASPDSYKQRAKTVGPGAVQEASLTFQVGSPKLKYWLVLLDSGRTNILSQVAIN